MSAPRGRPARVQRAVAYADTNLFVALLAGPGHPLHEPALGLLRRVADGELGLILTTLVVAELVHVVRSLMGWTRRVAADRIGSLLQADGLVLPERATLVHALELCGAGSRLDFADAYLAAALEVGPRPSPRSTQISTPSRVYGASRPEASGDRRRRARRCRTSHPGPTPRAPLA